MASILGHLATTVVYLVLISIIINILKQLFYRNPNRPPVVWHWLPLIGSTVEYGQDPYKFFLRCQKQVSSAFECGTIHLESRWLADLVSLKYGDCFTFYLLGMKVTVFLGPKGNSFILNGKLKDLNAEVRHHEQATIRSIVIFTAATGSLWSFDYPCVWAGCRL